MRSYCSPSTYWAGYPQPAQPPEVIFLPDVKLQQKACRGACVVYGWYPNGRIIYLDDRLKPAKDIWARSILMHELVHYVQQESGAFGDQSPCEKWSSRERDAYKLQLQWLLKKHAWSEYWRLTRTMPIFRLHKKCSD